MKKRLVMTILFLFSALSAQARAEDGSGPLCFDVKVHNDGLYMLKVNVYHRDSHCHGQTENTFDKGDTQTFTVSAGAEIKLQAVAGRSKSFKIKQVPEQHLMSKIACYGTADVGFACRYRP